MNDICMSTDSSQPRLTPIPCMYNKEFLHLKTQTSLLHPQPSLETTRRCHFHPLEQFGGNDRSHDFLSIIRLPVSHRFLKRERERSKLTARVTLTVANPARSARRSCSCSLSLDLDNDIIPSSSSSSKASARVVILPPRP